MTAKRPHINKDTKIAACLLELWALRGHPLPYGQATQMTAAEIGSLVEWHHCFPFSLGGTSHPTNISPLLIQRHREETKKVTRVAVTKTKRRARKQALIAIDVTGDRSDGHSTRPKPKRKWPSRPFPKRPKAKR